MKLKNKVTVNIQGSTVDVEELNIITIDNSFQKFVMVKMHPSARPLLIWDKQTYDEVGDYTQAQVENRILEVLGEDLQQGLQTLFNIEIL